MTTIDAVFGSRCSWVPALASTRSAGNDHPGLHLSSKRGAERMRRIDPEIFSSLEKNASSSSAARASGLSDAFDVGIELRRRKKIALDM